MESVSEWMQKEMETMAAETIAADGSEVDTADRSVEAQAELDLLIAEQEADGEGWTDEQEEGFRQDVIANLERNIPNYLQFASLADLLTLLAEFV